MITVVDSSSFVKVEVIVPLPATEEEEVTEAGVDSAEESVDPTEAEAGAEEDSKEEAGSEETVAEDTATEETASENTGAEEVGSEEVGSVEDEAEVAGAEDESHGVTLPVGEVTKP